MFRSHPVHISLHLTVDHHLLISDPCTIRFTGSSTVTGSDPLEFCPFLLKEILITQEYTVILRSTESNTSCKISCISTDSKLLVVTQ